MRLLPILLLLASCAPIPAEPDPPEEGGAPGGGSPDGAAGAAPAVPPPPLPAGFEVRGDPVVEEPLLDPSGSWRRLRSRLTTLQADVRRSGEDALLSFESGAVHVTRQDGSRVTWRLPAGLALTVETAHVLVRADLTLTAFDGEGVQVPTEEEVTVAIVTVTEGDAPSREFRLVVKGGAAFRSMSSG